MCVINILLTQISVYHYVPFDVKQRLPKRSPFHVYKNIHGILDSIVYGLQARLIIIMFYTRQWVSIYVPFFVRSACSNFL